MNDEILTFVCSLDKISINMDFSPDDLCVRLYGFNRDELGEEVDSVNIFSFDIETNYFHSIKSKKGNYYIPSHIDNFIQKRAYILLKFKHSNTEKAYYIKSYNSESGDGMLNTPQFIEVISMAFAYQANKLIKKNNLAFDLVTKINFKEEDDVIFSLDGEIKFNAYSVGQGMCSLLHNGVLGVLVDCGAGTPIKKINYQKLSSNQLAIDLLGLKEVYMILSHLDSDHHRLLSWDECILKKVSKICIPSNTSDLFLKDKSFNGKVVSCKQVNVSLPSGNLKSFRTQPAVAVNENNNNALVSIIKTDKETVLLAGDYLYSLMLRDGNSNIKNLSNEKYSFIVVPHHGDESSQNSVFQAYGRAPLAFFSAGDHSGYNHPHALSVLEHERMNYVNVIDNEHDQIDKITLDV